MSARPFVQLPVGRTRARRASWPLLLVAVVGGCSNALPPGDGDASVPDLAPAIHCGIGGSTFPDFDRRCVAATDCFIALHQTDCCGSHVALGLAASERARFAAAEAICDGQYPGCGCAPMVTVADDGAAEERDRPIVVTCDGGACRTHLAAAMTVDMGSYCGGKAGVPCPAGSFCDFAAGICGGNDATGTCVIKPATCSKELHPVCGCDQKNYDNHCMRQAAGVALAHEGACGPACADTTFGYCAGGLACLCCPAGGPAQHCICSTPCTKDGECGAVDRPACQAPAVGQMGFCAPKNFSCCWLCQ